MDRDQIIAKVETQMAETSQPETPQETPVETKESAPEANGTEAVAKEQATTTPEAVKDAPIDWWDTKSDQPEVANRIKSIQREFNKKAELASRVEKEANTYKSQLDETARAVKEALMNPEKYREWRRQLGFQDEVTEAKAELGSPKFSLQGISTPEELEGAFTKHLEERDKMWEARLQNAVSNATRVQEQKVAEIAQPIAKEKWDVALSKMKDEYGDKWAEVEASVVNILTNGPYADMYRRKLVDEKGILDKVFKAEFPDKYVEHIMSKKAKTAESTARSVTEVPKRGNQTPLPSGKTPDDIIARVNARVPRK